VTFTGQHKLRTFDRINSRGGCPLKPGGAKGAEGKGLVYQLGKGKVREIPFLGDLPPGVRSGQGAWEKAKVEEVEGLPF